MAQTLKEETITRQVNGCQLVYHSKNHVLGEGSFGVAKLWASNRPVVLKEIDGSRIPRGALKDTTLAEVSCSRPILVIALIFNFRQKFLQFCRTQM